jgi:endonuclease/exonuclease/phosphatase family metal-dependent hydrolase
MIELRVASWNVLHRVHGLNWSEPAVAAFPEEQPRTEGIAARVERLLDEGAQAVGLQEVSGDMLAELRRRLEGKHFVFAHRSPRLPKMRQGGASGLDDGAEFLVVIVADPRATLHRAGAFESDPGKGFLAVDLGEGVRLVCTHVSFGERSRAQLGLLAEVGRLASQGAVLVGDFNARAREVAAGLGSGWILSDLSGQGPTRVATPEGSGKVIDHVAVHRGKIREARVLDGAGFSDHHPIVGRVEIG